MTGVTGPRRPLIFAGRHQVGDVPEGELVDGWEATPHRLVPLLNATSRLVLLDPLSFPFEVLRPVDRDVPVAAALPSAPAGELEALLGGPLLDHLGPGDRVAAEDATWEEVSLARGWPPGMRLPAGPDDPEAVLAEALRPGAVGERRVKEEGRRRAEALAYLLRGMSGWEERAVRVVDVGERAGPWRHLLPGGIRLTGSPAAVPIAVDDASVEAAVGVGVLGDLPEDRRQGLVGEMWRVIGPGGVLAVVDDVVPVPGAGRPGAFGRGGLPRLLLGVTGAPALSRVRSIRYPGEALHRGAGMSVRKAGGSAP